MIRIMDHLFLLSSLGGYSIYQISSWRNAFRSDPAANIIININGKAAAREIICKGFIPPARKSPTANTVCTIPHIIFFWLDGFKFPSSENMERTKVPELADVMKKVQSNNNATKQSILENGYCPNTVNSPVSGNSTIFFNTDSGRIPLIPT